jgi:hypothetical protein
VSHRSAFVRACDCLWLVLAGGVLLFVPVLIFFGGKAAYYEWKHSDPDLRAFMKVCVVEQDKPARRCKELHRWR